MALTEKTMTAQEKLNYIIEAIKTINQTIDNEAPDLAYRRLSLLLEEIEGWTNE
jgi:hypothetical protein